jgi:hypothetical protein
LARRRRLLVQMMVGPAVGDATGDTTGDSVTDVMCFIERSAWPEWMNDPASWRPSIGVAMAAARGEPGALQALRLHADQLAGAGWGMLAGEFLRFAADSAGFASAQDLPSPEAAILSQLAEEFRA